MPLQCLTDVAVLACVAYLVCWPALTSPSATAEHHSSAGTSGSSDKGICSLIDNHVGVKRVSWTGCHFPTTALLGCQFTP